TFGFVWSIFTLTVFVVLPPTDVDVQLTFAPAGPVSAESVVGAHGVAGTGELTSHDTVTGEVNQPPLPAVPLRCAVTSGAGAFSTLIVCCSWCAAAYWNVPSWSASTMQLPGARNVTVLPVIEQAPVVLAASMLNVTSLPESPPVADTV